MINENKLLTVSLLLLRFCFTFRFCRRRYLHLYERNKFIEIHPTEDFINKPHVFVFLEESSELVIS